jgi:hypothetical protein
MPKAPNGEPELFVSTPPAFWIDEDGIGHIQVVSGGREISFRCTPHVLLAGSSAAMRAYVEWDAAQRLSEPAPIKKGA